MKIPKLVKFNVLNILSALMMLVAFLVIREPKQSYVFLKFEGTVCVWVFCCVLLSMPIYFVMLIISFLRRKNRLLLVFALIFSYCIYCLWFTSLFPWARWRVQVRPTQDVGWREQSLSMLQDGVYYFCKDNGNIIPNADEWQKVIISEGFDFDCRLEKWGKAYDSSIVLNENLKGKHWDDLDENAVLFFEGPNGTVLGNKETFNSFAEKNGYCYFVLVNGRAGRFSFSDKKVESMHYDSIRNFEFVWQ